MQRIMMKHTSHRSLVILSLMMLVLAACGNWEGPPTPTSLPPTSTPPPSPSRPQPLPTPTKPPPPPDWTKRWLEGVPCRAPCWEGITPGKTTASEAVEILNGSPLVSLAQKKTFALVPDLGRVLWNWTDGKQGGDASYSSKDPAEVIYSVNPQFPDRFRFQDVMQAYDEPSHIVAIAERPPDCNTIYYSLWVIYLPQGFLVRGGGPIKPDLEGNTQFYQVVFSIPTHSAIENTVYEAKVHPDWVLPWQGFKGFGFYCRDNAGGKWCLSEPDVRPCSPMTPPH